MNTKSPGSVSAVPAQAANAKARLRELAEAATQGPWTWDEPGHAAPWAAPDDVIRFRLLRAPMSDFTARMAQLQLQKLDNEALIARFTDASIALAIRRGVTPQQVHREALASFAWPESDWPKVRDNVLGWLAEGDDTA